MSSVDHVLLIVNSYVTNRDPRRGAKFRLQLETYAKLDWKVGLVAVLQRDYALNDCVRAGGFLIEERAAGVPIIRDCTYYSILRHIPGLRSIYIGARLASRAVARYIRQHGKPDIIHAHGSQWAGVVANHFFHKLGIPYVLTEHMTNYSQGAVPERLMPLMRKIFADARMRLPISRPLGVALEGIFGRDFRPWIEIPNMLEERLFEVRKAARSEHGGFIFLTVSQLVRKKGIDVLLRAFAKAFKGTEARLRIGGDGEERGRLEVLAERLGIQDQVRFLGYIPRQQVAQELRRADAYVLSSYHETFGIPVIEAHAAGIPVIATRCGGPESLINDNNGLLVDTGDIDGLASAMREIVQRIDRFDPEAIIEGCRARFSPRVVLDRLQQIYAGSLHSAEENPARG